MQQFIQQIIIALLSVVFAKWLDIVWAKRHIFKQHIQNFLQTRLSHIDNKKISQFDKKIYLSDWTYYIVTLGMLYGILTLTCLFLYFAEKYFQHHLQENFISTYIINSGNNIHNVFSLTITFFIYPLINLISQIFSDVSIFCLKKLDLSLMELSIQDIRMNMCVAMSLLLAISVIRYTF